MTNINEKLTDEVEKPSDRITITIDGEQREIFMSAGLASRLQFMCNNLENLTEVYSNLALQVAMVLECLAPRTKHGEQLKEINLDDFDLSHEEYKRLLDWAQSHTMYFFFERVNDLMKLKDPANKTAKLMAYWSGMLDSQIEKQSVGGSTAT